jgi:hypothetical protein
MLSVLLMDSSQFVKSDYEKKCIGIINDVPFITHIHTVKCVFELQNRWSNNQSWWCASFRHSFKSTHAITSVRSKVVNSVSVDVLFFQLEWNVSVSECFDVLFRSCTVHIHIYIYIYIVNKNNSNSR